MASTCRTRPDHTPPSPTTWPHQCLASTPSTAPKQGCARSCCPYAWEKFLARLGFSSCWCYLAKLGKSTLRPWLWPTWGQWYQGETSSPHPHIVHHRMPSKGHHSAHQVEGDQANMLHLQVTALGQQVELGAVLQVITVHCR